MSRQRVSVLVDPLRKLLRRGARAHAGNLLGKLRPVEVARLIDYLNEEESSEVFALMMRDNPSRVAEMLSELEPLEAVRISEGLPEEELTGLVAELPSDDAAELIAAMPEDVADRIMELLADAAAAPLEGLLRYEEETAGRIMTPEVFALHEDTTVQEAINALRDSRAAQLEMVFYLYVTDDRDHLVGVCSLRDLLLASPSQPLRTVMSPRVISVSVHTDQEEVARLVARYNFLALPVVDEQNKLVGVVTVDDVIDVIRDEETEDILLMVGVGEGEDDILGASLWRSTLTRLPWLLVAFVGGVIASQIIGHFEPILARVVALAAFIPVIAGMGGNIGTQSAIIIVRGLATGRITSGQAWRVVLRQLGVGSAVGLMFGVLLGLLAGVLFPGSGGLGFVVGLGITVSMVVAALVGTAMPVLFDRLGVDPAVATGPMVTTSVDVLGVLTYFGIATLAL